MKKSKLIPSKKFQSNQNNLKVITSNHIIILLLTTSQPHRAKDKPFVHQKILFRFEFFIEIINETNRKLATTNIYRFISDKMLYFML